jgi:hypothetical protein
MSQKSGDEHVETRTVNGTTVEVYGCWDKETPENEDADPNDPSVQ